MAKTTPLGFQWRSHPAFVLSTVAIGLFSDLFLYGLIIPVLPFLLQDRLQLAPKNTQDQVDKLLAAFSAASVLFSIPAGWLADWFATRRTPYLLGLVVLIVATGLFAVAEELWVLVLSRVLQGFSAAVVNATGLAMVIDTVGSKRLGVTLGTIHSFIAVGELGAPPLGGILYAKTGYNGVLVISIVILSVDLVMRALVIETKSASTYAIESHSEHAAAGGREPTEVDQLLPKQDVALSINENSTQLLPILYCLKDKRLLTALLLTFVQALIIGTYDATLTTEAAAEFGFSSLESGILFLSLGLPNLFFAPFAGLAVDRVGTRLVATVGYAAFAPCLALLRLPGYHLFGRLQNIMLFCIILTLNGICGSISSAPGIVEATHVVEEFVKGDPFFFGKSGPYGQLFGLNWFVFNIGLTAGPLWGGGLRESIGYGNMYALVAGLSASTAILSSLCLGRRSENEAVEE